MQEVCFVLVQFVDELNSLQKYVIEGKMGTLRGSVKIMECASPCCLTPGQEK